MLIFFQTVWSSGLTFASKRSWKNVLASIVDVMKIYVRGIIRLIMREGRNSDGGAKSKREDLANI